MNSTDSDKQFTLDCLATSFNGEYRKQVDRLSSYCFDRSTAEEILQEAYFRSIEMISTFTSQEHFSKWIYTVARNLAVNQYRHSKRNTEITEATAESIQASDIEAMAATEALHSYIAQALTVDLKTVRGQVVHAFYIEGKKAIEIAQELDVSQNTVLSHLHRFRATLRKTLEDQVAAA